MKKDKNIECEIRGCITVGDFNEIRPLIEKEWGKFEESPELAVFFEGRNVSLKINKNGCILTIKETVDLKTRAKKETELRFEVDSIPSVINFLAQSGYDFGLFSYCYRYGVKRQNRSITVKLNTKIGDIFEIDEVVQEGVNYSKVYSKLTKLAEKYGLDAWSRLAYQRIVKESWKDVRAEPLIVMNKLHPFIERFIKEAQKVKLAKSGIGISIALSLKKKLNDYSFLEDEFKGKTKTELLSSSPVKVENYNEPVSIVIPTYNSRDSLRLTLKSIERQKLHKKQRKLIEVIVVDDGSEDDTEYMIKTENFNLNLRYFKQNNLGRAHARNLGVSIAHGNVLVFLDSDVILESHFLNEHIARHHFLENIVLVSFKQNIEKTDSLVKNYRIGKKNIKPDITRDFRFEKTIKKSWLRMHRHVRNIEVRKVRILKETDNFKCFGKDRIVGVWDLPSMVVANALSLKKESFDNIGGFNLQFRGWGMEDTFLGACLIADGNYIVPCFSTAVFHIEHPFRSGSQLKRISEFNRNVLVYLELIHKPLSSIFKFKSLKRYVTR